MCSQRHEMTKSEIRRLQTNEDAITMLANTVRDQVVRDEAFKERDDAFKERSMRLFETMNNRVTAVEGTVQEHGTTLQEHGTDIQQLQRQKQQHDNEFTTVKNQLKIVKSELDELRALTCKNVGDLEREGERMERQVANQAAVAALPGPADEAARGFVVENVFQSRFGELPLPGKNGYVIMEESMFYRMKVVVGNHFSSYSRNDVISFVEKFGGLPRKNLSKDISEYRSLMRLIV